MTDTQNDNGPKVVDLPTPKNEIAAAGEVVSRNLDVLIANFDSIAKLNRAKYLAYLRQGFSKSEALELCTK